MATSVILHVRAQESTPTRRPRLLLLGLFSNPSLITLSHNTFTMAATPAHELKLDPKYDHYDYPTVAPVAQNGHPGHTTPEQDAQVFQLRTQLESEGYTKNLDTLTLVCICP
jgi:hypothetical protein